MQTDFQKGDIVEYCGEQATVVHNYGTSGLVELQGGGHCAWYWVFAGTPVTLVRRAEKTT